VSIPSAKSSIVGRLGFPKGSESPPNDAIVFCRDPIGLGYFFYRQSIDNSSWEMGEKGCGFSIKTMESLLI